MSQAPETFAPTALQMAQLRIILNTHRPPVLAAADIAGLVSTAQQQGVAPFLHWKLQALGVDLALPEWQPLRAHYQRQVNVTQRYEQQARKIGAALRQANIPALWLKGFALAHTVYPNPNLRPMVDLDVLVPYAQRADALHCLYEVGYVEGFPMLTERVQELWHHYKLRGEVLLELHYALLGMSTKLLPPRELAWFWQHTQTIHQPDFEFTAFAPEAELLYLCAHALLQHEESEFNLLRALDIHLLLKHNPALDWDLVLERATELGWRAVVTRALELSRGFFETPLPERVQNALDARLIYGRRQFEKVHAPADATRAEKTFALLEQMDRTRQWHWIIGSLLPRAAFMRQRYRVRQGWQLPFFYLYRWSEIARDVLQTLLKRAFGKFRKGDDVS